jgi:hypothetical protein
MGRVKAGILPEHAHSLSEEMGMVSSLMRPRVRANRKQTLAFMWHTMQEPCGFQNDRLFSGTSSHLRPFDPSLIFPWAVLNIPKNSCASCKERISGKHKRCGRCKIAYYCTKTCQRDHWGTHKKVCQHQQLAESTVMEGGYLLVTRKSCQ